MNSKQTLGQYLSIINDWKRDRGEFARYAGESIYRLPLPLQKRLRKAFRFEDAGMKSKSFSCLSILAAEALLKNGINTKAVVRKRVKSGGLQKLRGIGPKIAEELERWANEVHHKSDMVG